MEPLTIALLAGGAILVLLGLKKSSSASQSQAQVNQGADVIQAGGNIANRTTPALQQINSNISGAGVKAFGGAAVAGAGAGETAAAGGAGAASSATLGAITFGVGAVASLAVILWAKHEARIKGAKTENAAMNLIVPGWIETIQGIISSYNNGTINDLQTVQELQTLRQLVYTSIQKYNHTPGVDWAGGGTQPGLNSQKYWQVKCDKHCTIGCCLFNNVIGPSTNNAIALVSHKQLYKYVNGQPQMVPWTNTFNVPAMAPQSTYGFKGTSGFPLTVTK